MRTVIELQGLIIDQQELIDNAPNGNAAEKKELLKLNSELTSLKNELEEAIETEAKAAKLAKMQKNTVVDRPLVEGAMLTMKIIATQVVSNLPPDSRGITHISRVHTMEDGSSVWVRIEENTLETPDVMHPAAGYKFNPQTDTHLSIQCRRAKTDNNLYWNWITYCEDPALTAKTKTAAAGLAEIKAKMDLLASYPAEMQESMVKLLLAS